MIFLIDYENVNNQGLVGIENLTKEDKIIILLKENNTFKAKTHILLEKSLVTKEYHFVGYDTFNALDFQLVAYLGLLCCKNPKEKFIIVSNDKGYDSAIGFLKGHHYNVERKSNLALSSIESEIKTLLPQLTQNERNVIVDVIEQYKTKLAIHNNIMKAFHAEKASIIYKAIKPLLKSKS